MEKKERNIFIGLLVVFFIFYFIPFEHEKYQKAVLEAVLMLQEYVREHTLTCLIPALFIAGGISSFVSQASVIKYFGQGAKKIVSYSVASVSGTILAVCSCTILPLFAGIYARGAGIGPATAFVYSGPAINILAIVLTARILGWELGLARGLGAVFFAVIIGLLMEMFFGKEDNQRLNNIPTPTIDRERPLYKDILFFLSMIGILIFATWAKPQKYGTIFSFIYSIKWYLVIASFVGLIVIVFKWFNKNERLYWLEETWSYSKQIIPLLFIGVVIAGFLLGRPNTGNGIIPASFIEKLVGGNSFFANFFASIVGAFMYFATLTEVPILQGLLGAGMGKGPALALLLSGPALSLPNMLVIRSVIGTKKTVVYVFLVVIMSTFAGLIYGFITN
ncbi:permease [Deferribacter autotrophicus]|uniref:Permease n=1 Tax=Deferribacter autotrophicus TaxID=500465 RepID=A0A5A8EZW6_9BACT|nr:permease [Deferribacter autotrophicus]KAA0256914.1 permease [Deferribacter autotrophicus]